MLFACKKPKQLKLWVIYFQWLQVLLNFNIKLNKFSFATNETDTVNMSKFLFL